MAKIDPIDTRQSMFDEPSRGSKQTMYLPCGRKPVTSMIMMIATESHARTHALTHAHTHARAHEHAHAHTPTCLSGSTMMAFSSSSDTSTQEVKEDLIMLTTRSLDSTSSFFTWSPVTLVFPAMP